MDPSAIDVELHGVEDMFWCCTFTGDTPCYLDITARSTESILSDQILAD